MLLQWFNAREAVEVGSTLADQFVPRTVPASAPVKRSRKKGEPAEPIQELEKFLQRVDREARPLHLNIYKRAKLASTFKWKLLESGVEAPVVDELTRALLVRLAAK